VGVRVQFLKLLPRGTDPSSVGMLLRCIEV